MWCNVTSSMSASIATLRDLGWQPSMPAVWTSDGEWRADAQACKVTITMTFREMAEQAIASMWARLTPLGANGGLDKGKLGMETTKRARKQLLSQGLRQQAQALEAIHLRGLSHILNTVTYM